MTSETKAILLTLSGFTLFSVSDACVKFLGQQISSLEVVAVSSAMISLVCISVVFWRKGVLGFYSSRGYSHFFRALCLSGAAVLNFSCLPHITLSEFYTIMFTAPFFVVFLSTMFWKESLDSVICFTVFLGFTGVLIGSGGFQHQSGSWSLILMFSPFLFALGSLLSKRITANENILLLALFPKLLAALIFLPYFVDFFSRDFSFTQMGVLILVAITDLLAYLCLGRGYQLANAGILAPLHYVQLFWGTLFGLWIWGQLPLFREVLGSCLVIVCGIVLMWRRKSLPSVVLNEN